MKVKNAVKANNEQLAGFLEPGPDGPIYMVNLQKFKKIAEYEDGRNTNLSGEQAYGLYSNLVRELLPKFGGGSMFSAPVQRLMLGEVEDLWDKVSIAMYPSRSGMFEMMKSEEMQEISVHRIAGLEGQLNIETAGATGLWLKEF